MSVDMTDARLSDVVAGASGLSASPRVSIFVLQAFSSVVQVVMIEGIACDSLRSGRLVVDLGLSGCP